MDVRCVWHIKLSREEGINSVGLIGGVGKFV
jgi:hypothetical protein